MNKPLKLFVLFSFVTHLLFGLLWLTQPENNIPWQSSDDMSIVISQNTAKKKPKNPVPNKKRLLQKNENTKNTTNQDVAKREILPPSNNLVIRSKIIAQLKSRLLNNFYYPKLAQKKNWEGKVTVGFLLHTTGQLSQIEIIHSSGHQILDNAAIKAISNITKLSKVNVNKNMNIQLPVIYRLSES